MYRRCIKQIVNIENCIYHLQQRLKEVKKEKDKWFEEYNETEKHKYDKLIEDDVKKGAE